MSKGVFAPCVHGARTMCALCACVQGNRTITQAEGSTLEGPLKAGACNSVGSYYFPHAGYYSPDGSR